MDVLAVRRDLLELTERLVEAVAAMARHRLRARTTPADRFVPAPRTPDRRG